MTPTENTRAWVTYADNNGRLEAPVANSDLNLLTYLLTYPQIEGKFTTTTGGLTNLFFGCKD